MANSQRQKSAFHMVSTVIVAGLLTACAGTPVNVPAIPPLENYTIEEIETVNLLEMSPEMEQFVDLHLAGKSRKSGRAWALAYAVLDPFLLSFDYDPQVTLTAQQAFRERKGNCLTFSNMFIAMAREAGLDAWFREVEIPPEWSSVNDTMLVSIHVNAAVHERGTEYVVDVSRRKTNDVEKIRRLSDREAEAQFYNNLGVDALIDNDLAQAYAYFSKAIETEKALAYVWSNIGVVFRRNGQNVDAMLAYQTALQIDPQQDVALNNLYTIYEEDGDTEAAAALQARVEKKRRRNPYYLLHLAEVANEEERWSDAIDLLNRAIRMNRGEYRFHYTLAQSQFYAGKTEVAQASLDRAKRLAPIGIEESTLTLPGGSL